MQTRRKTVSPTPGPPAIWSGGYGALVGLLACLALSACSGEATKPAPARYAAPDQALVAQLTSELQRELAARGIDPQHPVASVPTGLDNAVFDLSAAVVPPGVSAPSPFATQDATLTWTDRLCGDYDGNGTVDLNDVIALAGFFNTAVTYDDPQTHGNFALWPAGDPAAGGKENWRRAQVDADGNGQINLGDIVPIAQHFGEHVAGYAVYWRKIGTTDWQFGQFAARSTLVGDAHPVQTTVVHFDPPYTEGLQFMVRQQSSQGDTVRGPASRLAEADMSTPRWDAVPVAGDIRVLCQAGNGDSYSAGLTVSLGLQQRGASATLRSGVRQSSAISPVYYDAIVGRFTSDGHTIWQHGLRGDNYQAAYGVTSDAAGNLIAVGETYGSGEAPLIVKYSPAGVLLWQRQLALSGDASLSIVGTDSQGNIYAAGTGCCVKLDSDGNVVWCRPESYSALLVVGDQLLASQLFTDLPPGGGAAEPSVGIYSFGLDGSLQWGRRIRVPKVGYVTRLTSASPGRLLVAAQVDSDILLAKLNLADGIIDSMTKLGDSEEVDALDSLVTAPDGSFWLTGVSQAEYPPLNTYYGTDVSLVHLAGDGALLAAFSRSRTENDYDYPINAETLGVVLDEQGRMLMWGDGDFARALWPPLWHTADLETSTVAYPQSEFLPSLSFVVPTVTDPGLTDVNVLPADAATGGNPPAEAWIARIL